MADFLINKGFEVLVIDNLSHGHKKNINPKAFFQKLDIREGDKINNCFRQFSPDFVFHFAAVTSKSLSDAKEVKEVNVSGTFNILAACEKNRVKKIVFASSAAVYGETVKLPIKETQKLLPLNPYGFSKILAESKILSTSKKHNLDYSILRYSNVYGPGQRSDTEGGVISIFCNHAVSSKEVVIYGDGLQTRDFIYIDDITSANYLSMLSPASFIANVSTGKETSILNLIKTIEKVLRKKMKIKFKAGKDGEIIKNCLNNSFIKQAIDWKPETKLEAGIAKTL